MSGSGSIKQRARTRWFLRWDKALADVGVIGTALWRAVWLGFLDDQDVSAVIARQYRTEEYFGEAHNNSGLFHWEASAIEAYFRGCRRVLVGAAGGGREVIALHQHGFEVEGFDCDPSIVQRCSPLLRKQGIRLIPAEPSALPDEASDFDGFILGWTGYSHIRPKRQRIRFLQSVAERLPPGAPILVSFHVRNPVSRHLKLAHAITTTIRRARRNREALELGDSLDYPPVHMFTRDEIEEEFTAAGFELAFYSSQYYTHAVGRRAGANSSDADETSSIGTETFR